MTDRSPAKVRRSADAKSPRKVQPRVEDDEIHRLRAELAAAHQRIADLERRQAEVANRIDWVIDSLRGIGE